MSHAQGQVFLPDGKLVGWYEYDGTSDVCCTKIFDTQDELVENWRGKVNAWCECGQPPEEVVLYSDYGDGFHWPGKACLRCKAIVGGLDPYAIGVAMIDGHPFGGMVEHQPGRML